VANDESNKPNPFDVATIKQLVALMSRHDLSEIDLREGDVRLRLRRGGREVAPVVSVASPVSPATPVHPPATAPAPPLKDDGVKPTKALHEIKSPTPGTFYSSANPGAEAFVRVGSQVTPTTVVCLIEAMKIFNEIQAECSGTITEILVENQQPVEYGQVLFRVDPTN
jgi:acetyl-CoA carboxylase biotin carboxyl carrier protein